MTEGGDDEKGRHIEGGMPCRRGATLQKGDDPKEGGWPYRSGCVEVWGDEGAAAVQKGRVP